MTLEAKPLWLNNSMPSYREAHGILNVGLHFVSIFSSWPWLLMLITCQSLRSKVDSLLATVNLLAAKSAATCRHDVARNAVGC